MDTALQRSENGGKEDELAGGVPGRHEQRRCGAEEMPSRTSCNCQSQQAGAGKSPNVLARFCVAIDCNRSSRSAGELKERCEHGLQHGFRFLSQLLWLEALHHIQQRLEPSFANAWVGGFSLSYHVKNSTEAKSDDARQVGPGVVRAVLRFELSTIPSFLPGSSSSHLDGMIFMKR